MHRALGFVLVLIFMLSAPSRVGAQSFDYAERPEYRDESRQDYWRGSTQMEVSSHEDSVREIPEPTVTESYASETLTFDAGSLLMVPAGFAAPGLWLLGAGGYVFGAPLVHLAHFRPLTSLASLGLRIVTPMIFGLTLSAGEVDDCGDEAPACLPKSEFVAGFVLGMGFAMFIDATTLAHEEVPVRRGSEVSVAPGFVLIRGGATGGVVGAF